MSDTDFEDLLRESLQARAAEVTPNPETWNRVQTRIRRRQQLRWALAGVTAAAAVALAAVALPGLLTSARVDLTPADRVPDAGILSNVELGGYLVHLEGETRLVDLDFEPIAGGGGPGAHFALAPGSTTATTTYVTSGDCQLSAAALDERRVTAWSIEVDACPVGAPRYSPDGAFLFWLERPGDQWVVRHISVTDGAPDGQQDGAFALPGAGDLVDVRLHDVALDQETAGFVLRLAGTESGTRSLYTTRIERPGARETGNGPADVEPEPEVDGHRPVAVASTNAADGTPRTYQLVVATDEGGAVTSTRLVALATGDRTDVALTGLELLEPGALWMTALGDVALFGDGQRVFQARHDGSAWTDPEVLHDEMTYAVPVPAERGMAPQPARIELPAGLAATDGRRLWLDGADVCADRPCDAAVIERFDVRPGTRERGSVALDRDWPCGRLELLHVGGEGTFDVRDQGSACVHTPVWSPDGRHLASVVRQGGGEGLASIHVRGYDEQGEPVSGTANNASFVLRLPADVRGAQLTDWVWTAAGGDTAEGLLLLSLLEGDRQVGTATVEVRRQADGAVALAADTPVVELADEQGYTPIVRVGGGATGTPMYQLALTSDGVELGRVLGPDVTAVDVELDASQHELWLTALGDRVAFGERGGRSYTAVFTPDGAFAVEALPPGVTYAAWQPIPEPTGDATSEPEVVEPAPAAERPGSAERTEPADASPTAEVVGPTEPPAPAAPAPPAAPAAPVTPGPTQGPVEPTAGTPPAAVMVTHERIRLAAGNGDIDRLVSLMPDQFTSSYGRGPGPEEGRAELEAMEQRGPEPYSILLQLLSTEPGEANGIWVWPAEHVTSGEHLGYRVGIRADGTWLFFVAGD